MLLNAGPALSHCGRYQKWRNERYCENAFDGHDFSPAFNRKRLMGAPIHFELLALHYKTIGVVILRKSMPGKKAGQMAAWDGKEITRMRNPHFDHGVRLS